jgi:hypothetical protein
MFDDARSVEMVTFDMKMADFYRGQNRARINDLFNGFPPYSPEEVETNGINVNVNFLESTRLGHDARSQFNNAFQKPGRYFTCTTDLGPRHKRATFGTVFSKGINRTMKRDMTYFETLRSKFAGSVLHGIGPSAWIDRDRWCSEGIGIEDLLLPSATKLDMKNLPFFARYISFTGMQLQKLLNSSKRDSAWNIPLVEDCIEYVNKESSRLMGANWPEIWSPEKMQERVKGDGGFYASDQVPTINAFDFYYWDDYGDHEGWRRRVIIDQWTSPSLVGGTVQMDSVSELQFAKSKFLYNPKNRVYADKLSEIFNCQFADLSAVGPFRYHNVRSLGFLLYATCHLQNRLRCRFNESVFESLMMYFRVRSSDDAERALKINLINRGIIDETVTMIPAAERFQVNTALVELGIQENQKQISEGASSYTQSQNYSQNNVEKTKFQVMAEVSSMNTLVSTGIQQAYAYQTPEYREIVRRFCRKDSRDPDVRQFRADCLRQGIPEENMVPEAWEVEPERVIGQGNKTLEMAISSQLMEWRNLYDPDAQRQILHDVTLAVTDDPGRADQLVPENPVKVTDSVHDAELCGAALLAGNKVSVKTGMNHVEYINTLLGSLANAVKKAQAQGNMATQDQITGMQMLMQHINQHIAILAQDESQKALVKRFSDALGNANNFVKGFQQRLQEQQQKAAQAQAQGSGQLDPVTKSKIQGNLITAKAKADNARDAHAQKTAQRQITFEQQVKQKAQQHVQDMRDQAQDHRLDLLEGHQEHELGLVQDSRTAALDIAHTRRKAAIDVAKGNIKNQQSADKPKPKAASPK